MLITDWLIIFIGSLALGALAFMLRLRLASHRALERRVAEFSALAQAGRAIASATLEVDRLCELIYQQASNIVDTSTFQLGLFDGNRYCIQLWQIDGVRQPPADFDLGDGEGIVGWMRRSGQPLLVCDFQTEADSLPARPRYISAEPTRSAVFVPLLAGAQVIGAIAIQSHRPNAFTDDHLRVLSIIASQAGSAIANARLLEAERRRVKQLDLIGQLSRQIAAILEIDKLFERVVELTQRAFGYYHVGVCIPDERKGVITFRACTHPALIGHEARFGEGIIGHVAQSGEPLLVNDVTRDTYYIHLDILPETRSELAVPLKFGDHILGVLDVQSDRKNAFGESDLFILQTLADQIAVAIREAQLYEAERHRRQIADTLRDIAAMLASTLDLDHLLDYILESLSRLVTYDAVAILLKNDEGTLTVHAARGLPAVCAAVGAKIPVREGGRFIQLQETRRPLIFGENDGTGAFHELIGLPADHSCLGAPLIARDELIGFLTVEKIEPGAYTPDDAQVVFALAGQAALAIANARLYEAEREETWVSTALLQVAEAVGSQTELAEILTTVVRLTPLLVGVEACLVFLWDDERHAFVPGSAYGLPRDRLSVFHSLHVPGAVWPDMNETRDSVMVSAHSLPPNVSTALGLREPRAFPLRAKGRVVGVMVVEGMTETSGQADRRMSILSGIAHQTAIAIENTRLVTELAARQRFEQELQVARDIQTSILPPSCPQVPGWQLAAFWRAAHQVGGDFYDFIPLPRDHHGLVIADVADKGVPAALFMAVTRTLTRAITLGGRRTPGEALMRINEAILSEARSGLFVTMFMADISPVGRVVYANAGHNPPLVVRAATGRVEYLKPHGMALGVMPQVVIHNQQTKLEDGDVLVLYTDGILDALDARGQEFGKERLEQALVNCCHRPADGIAAAIQQAITEFVGDEPPFDDLTLVVAKRTMES